MIDLVLYLITAVLYGLLGSRDLILQRRPNAALAPDAGSYSGEREIHRLIPLAWITHVLLLQHTMVRPDHHLDLSVGHALSLIGAMTVAIYWFGSRKVSLGILRPTVLFLAFATSFVPLLLPSQKSVSFSQGLAFELHIVVSLLAYSLFVIAALHAGLMVLLEGGYEGAGGVGGLGGMAGWWRMGGALVAQWSVLTHMVVWSLYVPVWLMCVGLGLCCVERSDELAAGSC